MPGEQRCRGRRFAQQFGDRLGLRGLGLGARAHLPPGFVEVDAHAADPGVGQQETGEAVVVVRLGVRHGDNGRGAWTLLNGGAVR